MKMKNIIIITLLVSAVLGFLLVKGSETIRDGLELQQTDRLKIIEQLK